MSYFYLFQQNPGLFFLITILSLIITAFVYGAFPIIFAKTRKTPITKKKYRTFCYGLNIIAMIFFLAFNGVVSGGPYFLWTSIFSFYGIKKLEKRGLLTDSAFFEETTITNIDKVCFCRKCGAKILEESRFCSRCGTKIHENNL